ncbi:MAG: helix-turn-helix domain containing protein [Novosphingobium sp.]|nr:helix-turn-helix domain containing protein [Novosphingobium sp.]
MGTRVEGGNGDTAAADIRGDALVEAAYQLLDEVGLEGLTIRAVLARTGLARRAFYDRFDSKDELVLEVFARTLRTAAVLFSAEIAGIAPAMDRLRLIVCGIVMGRMDHGAAGSGETSRRSAALSREHLRLADTRPEDLRRALAPLVDLIAAEIARGMERGEVRRGDAAALAMLVYNLVATTVHTELLAEEAEAADRARREALAGEIWEFARRALAA